MELSKTKTSLYASLSNKKMRDKYGLFMAEGSKCITDLLEAFELEALIICEDYENKLPVNFNDFISKMFYVNKNQINRISSLQTPSNLIGIFKKADTISQTTNVNPDELYLLLDNIQDPGNLGTIIRTADWFGIKKIFASKDTADCYNPKVVQATMGSLSRVKVEYIDLVKLIEDNPQLSVYGTILKGENLYDIRLGKSGFIIMGNEGKGISENLKNKIKIPLTIPPYITHSHGESLNVSVATGIILAFFRKI